MKHGKKKPAKPRHVKVVPCPNIFTAEDVIVDNRGYIYLDTMQQGLYILRCTV